MIVGLAPAAHGANRTGRVFTGDGPGGSGDFLMSALHRAGFANIPTSQTPGDGLVLRDAYIAAAVRCAPPDNKPTPEEIANCLTHLDAEVAALPRIRVVVPLGKIAFDAYLRMLVGRGMTLGPRPTFGHGTKQTLPSGLELIGCYHPEPAEYEHREAHTSDDGRCIPSRASRDFAIETARAKPGRARFDQAVDHRQRYGTRKRSGWSLATTQERKGPAASILCARHVVAGLGRTARSIRDSSRTVGSARRRAARHPERPGRSDPVGP